MRWTLPACLALALAPPAAGEGPVLLTPADVVSLAAADAAKLDPETAHQTRYLWLPNLEPEERERWRRVLDGHCNQLSREPDLTPVRPLARGHLAAVRLDDYGWRAEVWDQFQDSDPTLYATVITTRDVERVEHWPGGAEGGRYWPAGDYRVTKAERVKVRTLAPWLGPDAAKLAIATGAKAPIVNALVFLDQTAASGGGRRPDYYDLQGVKDEATWLALVGAEVEKDAAFGELLAAVGLSGVTQEPRVIQRLGTRAGAVWGSYDVKRGTAEGEKNALRVIGTDGKGRPTLKFDATEKYGSGPNGLWKFLLADARGVKQAAAPDDVAQDATPIVRNSHAVLVCVSCIRCHTDGGLQDVSDWWRNFPPELDPTLGDRAGAKAVGADEVRRLRRQYRRRLEPFIAQDRQRYADALKEACGLTPERYAAEFARAWAYAADSTVDLAWASRELGVPPATIEAAVARHLKARDADPVLAALVLPAGRRRPVPLAQWREAYATAQTYLSESPK